MGDIHSVRIVTYRSENADTGKEWVAWLILPSGRLPLAFFADTEAQALTLAQGEWDKHRDAREQAHQRREEGRIKAAETKARKAAA
jgi:hypothetical protein